LLDHGADANFQDVNRSTPLSHAVAAGKLEVVQRLLEHNVDANLEDKDGLTPLHWFFYPKGEYTEIVRLLLKHGANPNARDNKRRTLLHLVLSWSMVSLRLEVASMLLAHGADVGAEDEEGRTPLQVASAQEEGEIAKLLSEYSFQ
jgi:ankyrin repeat protein